MAIDITVKNSPGWWIDRLTKRMTRERKERFDRMQRYGAGQADLPTDSPKMRAAFEAFQRKSRTNWAGLIVAGPMERMDNIGFRTAVDSDEEGDEKADKICRANSWPLFQSDLREKVFNLGEAYAIVGPPDEITGQPVITVEDPREVYGEYDRLHRNLVAAVKFYYDADNEEDRVYLYARNADGAWSVWSAFRPGRRFASTPRFTPTSFVWDEERGGEAGKLITTISGEMFRDCPVVHYENHKAEAEFEPFIDHIDRINHTTLQRMVIITMQAYRQRALKGKLEDKDEQGRDIDWDKVFEADPGALWQLPDDVDIWESAPPDLTPILTSNRHDIQDLASVSRMPLTMFMQSESSGSAEGAELKREGLTNKTKDRINREKVAMIRIMSLAFMYLDDVERSDRLGIEPLYAPVETYGLQERHQAGALAKANGLPWASRMTDILGYRPAELKRLKKERAADLLYFQQEVAEPDQNNQGQQANLNPAGNGGFAKS